MALVKRDGAAQERDRGAGLLVGQHLGVGQARGVIDRDMHKLPANPVAVKAGQPIKARAPRVGLTPRHTLAGAALDAPELFDVDVTGSPGRSRS